MALSGSFTFVKIPATASEPIESHTADKAGGLNDDALVKFAKNYFFEITGAKKRAQVLEEASADERQALAAQVRTQLASSSSSMLLSSNNGIVVVIVVIIMTMDGWSNFRYFVYC